VDTTIASDHEIEPPAELVKRCILQDLVANAEYGPSVGYFSPESFVFSFVVDMYRVLHPDMSISISAE
jgi:hypothetical protein